MAAPTGPDIALVAIDPRDGSVERWWAATTSSRAYNAALQGVGRQPGSSFKTFMRAALEAGISPDSVWESSGFQKPKARLRLALVGRQLRGRWVRAGVGQGRGRGRSTASTPA